MKIVKCLTVLFTLLFIVSFSSSLSAKHHRRSSTSFSLNFLNVAPVATPVVEHRTYVERWGAPGYRTYCRYPVYEESVYAPAYREAVFVERSYPTERVRVYEYPRFSYWGY